MSKKKNIKRCFLCGSEYIPIRESQKYCSVTCSIKAQKKASEKIRRGVS